MKKIIFLTFILISLSTQLFAQKKDTVISSTNFSEIKLRSIGPAFMSGRIADIAIHPTNNNVWYVAVGSGGVWKTTNSGTTWEPIFDDQPVYSIGCITIDPNNPNIIWVGTGENVGGRHVGYGDGIYRSEDGGKSWQNMGLKKSEHISKIIIHPTNSNIIMVAAQGPLWNKGGERGFYKSTDFGKTWRKTLGDDEWVGVTDIVIDSRNPNLLYAATWQRHRNVASYIGGGPGTGVYKSVNNGESWKKLKSGLPKTTMGKIGLAISPQKPDVIYAAIELNRRKGSVYRSDNRGESWNKMSDAVSGATGPHYYQELYASPHKFDKIFLVDVRMQVSEDGGKTFKRMSEKHKHSDNHALAFRYNDPNYLLVGTDGGLYESFDNTKTWKFINNLPVTQFYKVAVDDKEPFYTIYGGTQDNSTQGGPSRTDNVHGIRNSDWFLTLGGDGHQPATEPGNPNIMYSESQEGFLSRIDRTTGEIVSIQPQPEEGEPYERFNWDSPILVSPHSPTRIYFASQRIWRSDNRGDSWEAISKDLTKNQERIELPIMNKTWSWDSPWDFYAMSNYNTITSISESPLKEGLIYAGTDDGLIQITEDGGNNWKKIEIGKLPGVPKTAFVNDIKADLFNENTVYVVLDNHKFGDLNPYLLKSNDKGKSWKSVKSNLPDKTLLWRVVQDHVKPELLFLGTEFGVYFTINSGEEWTKLKAGIPTISIRDLVIQKRENDLVGASFGRGFYVFDDYTFLRDIDTKQLLEKEAEIFTGRTADLFIPRAGHGFSEKGSQGASYFTAENPPFGAMFTYYLSKEYLTKKKDRVNREKKLIKDNKNIDFPGWDEVDAERKQPDPKIWITIKDIEGNIVRKISAKNKKGFNRISWDLRYPDRQAINIQSGTPKKERKGYLAAPGKYYVTLSKEIDGLSTILAGPKEFNVKLLYEGALKGSTHKERLIFNNKASDIENIITAAIIKLKNAMKKIDVIEYAASSMNTENSQIVKKIYDVKQKLLDLDNTLYGNRSKKEVGEKYNPTILNRFNNATRFLEKSIYGPTETQIKSLDIAEKQFNDFNKILDNLIDIQIPNLEKELVKNGAPIVE